MKSKFSTLLTCSLLTIGLAVSVMSAPAFAKNDKDNKGSSSTGSSSSTGTTNTGSTNTGSTNTGNTNTGSTNTGSTSTGSTNTGSSTTKTAVCSVNNVLLGGVASTACAGPLDGNDTGSGAPLETLLDGGLFKDYVGTGVDWTLAGKSDGQPGEFNFSATNNTDQGTWKLGEELTSSTFVISLKSSTSYSAYLFKNYNFDNGLDGIFNTIGVALDGSGKAGKGLSHASLFVSNIKTVTPPPPVQEVPEPATIMGLGLVFGAMVASRRRKAH